MTYAIIILIVILSVWGFNSLKSFNNNMNENYPFDVRNGDQYIVKKDKR